MGICLDNYRIIMAAVITAAAAITPMGNCRETISLLFAGETRVSTYSDYGAPISLAPFSSGEMRSSKTLAALLKKDLPNLPDFNNEETLFIFAAAKGDLTSVEDENDSSDASLLQNQAEKFAADLALPLTEKLIISNACASGTAAADTARDYLESGLYKRAVLAGFDLISRFTASGFNALGAISETGARPFDAERSGMSLGEGAGVIILEQREPLPGEIVLAGSGTSNDANHRTGPSRDGAGLADAMNRAIRSAGISADQIGAVKCHGTATPFNDAMEAKALTRTFGENQPPAVSLKGAIGHLSGAGSLVETVLSMEFLRMRKIPGTYGFVSTDLPEPISVSAEIQKFEKSALLVTAAGFGGLNSALVLREVS